MSTDAKGQPITFWGNRIWRDPIVVSCATLLVIIVLAAMFGPMLYPYGYEDHVAEQFLPPSWAYWAGTDIHGRDVFLRMLVGARISLTVATIAAVVSLTIGVAVGMTAGYAGGIVDTGLMRIVDVMYSLPRLVFVIVLMAALEAPVHDLLVGAEATLGLPLAWLVPHTRLLLLFTFLGMIEWMTMARIVRGQVLVLREQQFVQAARALGQSHRHILRRHLLPNLAGLIIVYLTLTIPVIILEESFLSFLGLGVRAPLASWGSLISDGAKQLNPIRIYWWLLIYPAAMMSLTLLALNFIGDTFRDALDPRSRQR